MKILVFFAFILLLSTAARAQCDLTVIDLKTAQGMMKVTNKIEEPPFMVACKKPPGLIKDRPATGLFRRSIVNKDSHGRKSVDFLLKILARARARVSAAKNQIENVKTCMSNKAPECAEIKSWIEHELPQFVKSARYDLALAQSEGEFKSWVGIASKSVNSELNSLGSYKYESWAPLTKVELLQTQDHLGNYIAEIELEARARVASHKIAKEDVSRFKEDALLTVRYEHYQSYHQKIASLPMLQYLKGPEVSRADVSAAFANMEAGLEKETQHLNEIQDAIVEPLSPRALEVLNYSSEVEEALVEDSRDCGLATSLMYTMSNRQIGNGLAIGLPIMAASFFVGPAVAAVGGSALLATGAGYAAGAAASGGFLLQEYKDFKKLQQQTMSQIYGDDLGYDQANLDFSARQLKYDIVTLPVGFGIGGTVVKRLTVGKQAMSVGRSLLQAK